MGFFMNGIWYYFIAFVLIWFFALVFKNKLTEHNVEVNFPVLMWKTQRLRGFIDRIAKRAPRFWRWYMNLGIFVCFGFMIFMTVVLFYSLQFITSTPSVSLIIPGVDVPGSTIYVPFVYGILGLATVLIVHEFSHGILARVENVSIKSIGLLLFAIIPGAFVEPDEDEVKDISRGGRLRIYAAGSMANLMLALIAMIVVLLLSSAFVPMVFHEDGVAIDRVVSDSPADGVLKSGMVIESINGKSFNSSEGYINVVHDLKPNSTVNIVTDRGSFSFNLSENPNNKSIGYMGIQAVKHYAVNSGWDGYGLDSVLYCVFPIIQLFTWIFLLNFGIGTFNLLPMKPLDGGLMLEELLSYKLSEGKVKIIVRVCSVVVLAVILVSLFASFALAMS